MQIFRLDLINSLSGIVHHLIRCFLLSNWGDSKIQQFWTTFLSSVVFIEVIVHSVSANADLKLNCP